MSFMSSSINKHTHFSVLHHSNDGTERGKRHLKVEVLLQLAKARHSTVLHPKCMVLLGGHDAPRHSPRQRVYWDIYEKRLTSVESKMYFRWTQTSPEKSLDRNAAFLSTWAHQGFAPRPVLQSGGVHPNGLHKLESLPHTTQWAEDVTYSPVTFIVS